MYMYLSLLMVSGHEVFHQLVGLLWVMLQPPTQGLCRGREEGFVPLWRSGQEVYKVGTQIW